MRDLNQGFNCRHLAPDWSAQDGTSNKVWTKLRMLRPVSARSTNGRVDHGRSAEPTPFKPTKPLNASLRIGFLLDLHLAQPSLSALLILGLARINASRFLSLRLASCWLLVHSLSLFEPTGPAPYLFQKIVVVDQLCDHTQG